ncbi:MULTISPECIES: hypothetical protein [Butyricimonas]|uniref:Uncharacterized protein n=1 Tax=Butyricimonas virosa TaxID=544645 RepID=A0ABX7H1U3_9BACT|nr:MULTISPECIES: hypothetical protein [Butyricimonas]MBO4958953.1 hypothetical protein [Butyricimonas sp.]MCI7163485.1 hypothetical protein [Butyricimonas virosa]MCI7292353.1 hypothetical protein [Butyricimonas virosa]MDY5489364.1 hypothetical protein [Butyricimonas virosa]MDY5532392.1 hypothetical protein [Butyricimonas virosa]
MVPQEQKRYSVIAMNLETVEDVEKVIHQCELIRQEITGGCKKWDSKRFMNYLPQANR